MGDRVRKQLEDCVPELEYYRSRKLFSDAEIRAIVKRRTDFEFVLRRHHPLLEDFMRYIAFELTLNELRRRRSERLKRESDGKPEIGDTAIIRRVRLLFERALHRHSANISLWMSFFEFLHRTGSVRQLGLMLARALQLHGNRPELWVKAAEFEFRHNRDDAAARALFQRGLRLNPDARVLWWSFFAMEVEHAVALRQRWRILGLLPDGGDASDAAIAESSSGSGNAAANDGAAGGAVPAPRRALLGGALARAIFENACRAERLRGDYAFRHGFLARVPAGDPFFAALRRAVSDSCVADFGSLEECLRDRVLFEASEARRGGDAAGSDGERIAARLAELCERRATPRMAELAVEWTVGWLTRCRAATRPASAAAAAASSPSAVLDSAVAALSRLCERALKAGAMAPGAADAASAALLEAGRCADAERLLQATLADYPAAVALWRRLLALRGRRLELDGGDAPPQVSAVATLLGEYERALLATGDSALPLWEDAIELCSAHCAHAATRALFIKALSSRCAGSDALKPAFVEWACVAYGGEPRAVREVIDHVMRRFPPATPAFLYAAVAAELSIADAQSAPRARAHLESLVAQEGARDADCWRAYLAFERERGEVARQQQLVARATRTLEPRLAAEFQAAMALAPQSGVPLL